MFWLGVALTQALQPASKRRAHFINLTNGIEALDKLPPDLQNNVNFVRIQSSKCEANDFYGILQDVDHNLLFHLATGAECVVYDFGSRGSQWPGAEDQKVPRAIWWGLEWIRYALTRAWKLPDGGAPPAALPPSDALPLERALPLLLISDPIFYPGCGWKLDLALSRVTHRFSEIELGALTIGAGHVGTFVAWLCGVDAQDVTGQLFAVRGRELFLFSQPRPVAEIAKSDGDWDTRTLTTAVTQSLAPAYTPLETDLEAFDTEPLV